MQHIPGLLSILLPEFVSLRLVHLVRKSKGLIKDFALNGAIFGKMVES